MPSMPQSDPPVMSRFSGLYRFIPLRRYAEVGIDPRDVPMGTLPAEDHPPYLPSRYGGNAYGLGLYERAVLPKEDSEFLDSLELDDPACMARYHRKVNRILSRLGLLIRFSAFGSTYYLIPRQYLAHYLVEVQAQADEVVDFLSGVLSRNLKETLKVGLISEDPEFLLNEIKTRMPHMDFRAMSSLSDILSQKEKLDTLVMVGDPKEFALGKLAQSGKEPPKDRREREAYGFFMAGRFYDLLEEKGELFCLCDKPLSSSRETVKVRFKDQTQYKRFLLFSHVFRTRRRYRSGEGLEIEVNRFDFNAFLSGISAYHETLEGLLTVRGLDEVGPTEIDSLPYLGLTLPRGSAPQLMNALKRWLDTFFNRVELEAHLPRLQKEKWRNSFELDRELPATLITYQGFRKKASSSHASGAEYLDRRQLAGCKPELLAGYKDTFSYLDKVLTILHQVRDGEYMDLPGLELSRLRKPFESTRRHQQLNDVLKLMTQQNLLTRLKERLNPGGILGDSTKVLENLEKLSLMGIGQGPLIQIRLIVLGHSTMSRVTFGKLPPSTLNHLTDRRAYASMDEALRVLRLFRLLSVAETAAAAQGGLTRGQVEELFALYDDAIRMMTEPGHDWEELHAARDPNQQGVQDQAAHKLLKLFNLFEFLNNWKQLGQAGPRQQEALAGYDPEALKRIRQVTGLMDQFRRYVGRFYSGQAASRPYFYRALTNCEMHGTGRLMPGLGVEAGFVLLWICVHCSVRGTLDFNRLLEPESPGELPERLVKIRRALTSFGPNRLTPAYLASLKETMLAEGVAYIHGSGLYLSLDEATGALSPRFLDAAQELSRLGPEVELSISKDLTQVPSARLAAMDKRVRRLSSFFSAMALDPLATGRRKARLAKMTGRLNVLSRRMEAYFLSQSFNLRGFSGHLEIISEYAPYYATRLFGLEPGSQTTARTLISARKLSALYSADLSGFQDMVLSHEMARAEFGPAATDVVGVSALQFESLTAGMSQLIRKKPRLAVLMMLATLLRGSHRLKPSLNAVVPESLSRGLSLGGDERGDLEFLLRHMGIFWSIASGEAGISSLGEVLKKRDALLAEALFLLAVTDTAARQEGLMSEDLLESFFLLQDSVRSLSMQGTSAAQAHRARVERFTRQYLAFEHYREIQSGQAPTASLRHLLETTTIPKKNRKAWLKKGRLNLGLERLLKLKGLYFISALDLLLFRHDVPVRYIYRNKALRSMGEARFERELFDSLLLYRGLSRLEERLQEFMLMGLTDFSRPVKVQGFTKAIGRLTYPNQIKLLFFGLVAARRMGEGGPGAVTVSFLPLAKVIESKFELANQAITALDPAGLMDDENALKKLIDAKEGIKAYVDPESKSIRIALAELARFDTKIKALRRARNQEQLKLLYYQELKKLKLTTHSTVEYQSRLERAFIEQLDILGAAMLENVRRDMAAVSDLKRLMELFERAWEEGLEMPLGRDRQQSLRDLLEINLERIRVSYLADLTARLEKVKDLKQLDLLWREVREGIKGHRRILGPEFDLLVAERFDRRATELN